MKKMAHLKYTNSLNNLVALSIIFSSSAIADKEYQLSIPLSLLRVQVNEMASQIEVMQHQINTQLSPPLFNPDINNTLLQYKSNTYTKKGRNKPHSK